MIRVDGTSKERLHIGIATKPSATRSTKTQILGRDSVDIAVGHDFRAERSGVGCGDKQGRDLVEFGRVLWNVLPHNDMVFSGVSPRAALHQCRRCTRKLWAMPHPLRLQSCDGDGVREAAAV